MGVIVAVVALVAIIQFFYFMNERARIRLKEKKLETKKCNCTPEEFIAFKDHSMGVFHLAKKVKGSDELQFVYRTNCRKPNCQKFNFNSGLQVETYLKLESRRLGFNYTLEFNEKSK